MNLNVALETRDFIILDKPAGVLSTPARFQERDPRRCLGSELQEQLKTQIFPVHRLDFEVSGLVIYAKNAQAHRDANAWFEKKQVTKTYRAWTQGPSFAHLPPMVKAQSVELETGRRFEWKCRLLRGKKRAYESPQGKDSLTGATYLGMQQGHHEWDLNPVTGRSHQLRYEMSRHGHPIVGDELYGSKEKYAAEAIALRAYRIDFSQAPGAQQAYGLPRDLFIEIKL
jgi:tRNA pseudouridine32 synthase/23S rRNA pseudouridine746 synthase